MSIDAIAFAKCLDLGEHESPQARLLLYVIAENTFNDSFVCVLGQDQLAFEAGRVSDRTVRRHLEVLTEARIVLRKERRDEHGFRIETALRLRGYKRWYLANNKGAKSRTPTGQIVRKAAPKPTGQIVRKDGASLPDKLSGPSGQQVSGPSGQQVSGLMPVLTRTSEDSPPTPQGGVREGEEVQLWVREETEGCPHVRPALVRILDVIPIQHPKPRALIAEVVEGLKAYPSNVLDAAAGDIVRNRKKLVAPKCVLEAAAKACAAAPIVRIQAGDASYQAWERWHTLRGAKVIVSMARTHGFSERSLWPPGFVAPSDSPPASRPEGAASPGGRLAERESPGASEGATP